MSEPKPLASQGV